MRNLLFILFFIISSFNVSFEPMNTVTLPIRVMGDDGTTASVTLIGNGTSATNIYLRLHSPSYPSYRYPDYSVRKASIRVNSGTWVDIQNSTADCTGFYEDNNDCVDGPLGSVRFRMTHTDLISQLIDGTNTVEFRFNYEDFDVSSGYRVLAIDLHDGTNTTVLTGTSFTNEDPLTWVAPTSDASRIANGATLFSTQNILTDGFDGPTIKASCADCHASDGRDLTYFNYSNEDIIIRSEFHGLTTTEGEDIASWIREINLGFDPPGRPWNPPYQPGAGLDADSVYNWAAGAGLDAVLEQDNLMQDTMFPNYPTVSDVMHKDSTLNRRETPIAFQLMDWNEWLPIVHPLDRWDTEFIDSDAYNTWNVGLPALFTSQSAVDARVTSGAIINDFNGFFDDVKDFVRENEDTQDGDPSSQLRNESLLGAYQWSLIKHWELMTKWDLEDETPNLYPEGEYRGWFGNGRVFFNVAPHIHGASKGPQTECTNPYFDTGWYELQTIMNTGNRGEGTGLKPDDWKYHFGHIGDFMFECNNPQPYRYLAAWIKVIQEGEAGSPGTTSGFYPRHANISRMDKLVASCSGKAVLGCFTSTEKEVFAIGALDMFMQYLDLNAASTWPRGFGLQEIPPDTYVPAYPCNIAPSTSTDYADAWVCMVEDYSDFFNSTAVDAALTPFAAWLDAAWPSASPTFASLITSPNPTPIDSVVDISFTDTDQRLWQGTGGFEASEELMYAEDTALPRLTTIDPGVAYTTDFVIATDSIISTQINFIDIKEANFTSLSYLGLRSAADSSAANATIEVNGIGGVRMTYRSTNGAARTIPTSSTYMQLPICLSMVYDAGTITGYGQSQCTGALTNLGSTSLTLPSTAIGFFGVWCRGDECEFTSDNKTITKR